MRGFCAGVLCGVLLTASVAAAVVGPQLVGDDGYLIGWDITVKTSSGKVECRDPFVWQGTKEIECKAR